MCSVVLASHFQARFNFARMQQCATMASPLKIDMEPKGTHLSKNLKLLVGVHEGVKGIVHGTICATRIRT